MFSSKERERRNGSWFEGGKDNIWGEVKLTEQGIETMDKRESFRKFWNGRLEKYDFDGEERRSREKTGRTMLRRAHQ